ncbi:carbohydrate binding domain-containing protein [Actinoplanes sp. NPDC051861]|uniref:carbohydrate binding domain-containing protein n=1 Tax=Actinoplanes sp. NPDC051861 TaxID=3155170 RepID=UPI0034195C97
MPNDVALEIFYDGGWHDLVAGDDVFADAPLVIQRGDGAESAAPRPASLTARLNNAEDTYRTSNPESPLFGKAGRNTPVRATVGGTVRAVTEESSWSSGQTRDFRARPRRGKAWVDLDSGGLLRRIGQWTEPLKSPFYTYNAALGTLGGYWPMEDARGTARAFTPVTGARNSALIGQSFDSQKRPPGSGPVAEVNTLIDTATFRMAPGDGASTSGWQYSLVTYIGDLNNLFHSPISLQLGNGYSVFFSLDDSTDTSLIDVFDPSGSQVAAQSANFNGYQFTGQWVMFVLKATYSAPNTTFQIYYRSADENSWLTYTLAHAMTPSIVRAAFANSLPEGSAYGHVTATVGLTDSLTDEARFTAFRGHAGETTAQRFARLCTAKNLAYSIVGDQSKATPMGPQPLAAFPEQLKEIRDTEDGLLFDAVDGAELALVLRDARYNRTPVSIDVTELPFPPPEVTDDLPVHNLVTAAQRDGGDATAEDSTGPLGTQDPPDGAGEYRHTVDVNLDDSTDLPQVANWWLRRGTVNLPRYPAVTVNLAALDAARVAELEAVDVGDVLELTGYRENPIRLHVLGYTETIGWPNARTIVFQCAPDQQFDVGVYGQRRYDLRTSTVSGSHTASATRLWVQMTADEAWSRTSLPYDWVVAGERIRVLGMTKLGSVAPVDGTFEAGIDASWYVQGGSSGVPLISSAGSGHNSNRSVAYIVAGSPSQAIMRSNATLAASPGQTFTASMWVWIATTTNVTAVIDWLNGGGWFAGASNTVSVTGGVWTEITVSGTAPATTTRVEYGPSLLSSPANGLTLFVDDVDIVRTDSLALRQAATCTRSVNGIRKTLPSGSEVHVATPGRWAR